ncbi:hypothetical protein JCM5350_001326 [Sporobolomyces pararoseus]
MIGIGIRGRSVHIHPWPSQLERDLFVKSVQDLYNETNSRKCKRLQKELEHPQFDLSLKWSTYPAWAQVECLGYTEWGKKEILTIKARTTRQEYLKNNSTAIKGMQGACIHHSISLSWQEPETPETFSQARSPSPTPSLPRARTQSHSPERVEYNWDLSFD